MAQALTPQSRIGERTDTSDCRVCASEPLALAAISPSRVLHQGRKSNLSFLETSSSARRLPFSRLCLPGSVPSLAEPIANPTWSDPVYRVIRYSDTLHHGS